MPDLKVGVLGCGAVSRYCHVPSLYRLNGVQLSAVADPDGASRRSIAVKRGIAEFDGLESMLAGGEVDAVIIALPTHMHAAAAVAVARSGRPFYLEKPIATSETDAVLVRGVLSETGVKAVVGFNRRAHPLYQRARQLIEDGAIGKVHGAQTVFSEPAPRGGLPPWKQRRETGGGALLDLGSHHVDLIRWLLDAEVETVSASIRTISTEDDFASLTMTLSSGATTQSMFTLSSAHADHIEIIGAAGTLRIERHAARLALSRPRRFGYGRREVSAGSRWSDIGWKVRRLARPSEDPSYFRAMRAFVRHLRGDGPSLASIDDGEQSLRVILAAEESSKRDSSPVRVTS